MKNFMERIPYQEIADFRYKTDIYMFRYDNAIYTEKLKDLI
jgi:hypothetical protein